MTHIGKMMRDRAISERKALWRQTHVRTATVVRIRQTTNETSVLDAVDAIGNCARTEQGLTIQCGWIEFVGRAASPERDEYTEGLEGQSEWCEPSIRFAHQNFREAPQSCKYGNWPSIKIWPFTPPFCEKRFNRI